MLIICLLIIFCNQISSNPFYGLYENTGFHCYSRDSMKLSRKLHGKPQTTDPPFEMTVIDDKGKRVKQYVPGKIYTVKLEAYVHFRGLMLQPRLCAANGEIIGILRGGKFIKDEHYTQDGIDFHQCAHLFTNDSITHVNDEKKFLVESKWITNRDIGNVQFVATIASENELYWEKWRPLTAFIKSPSTQNFIVNKTLFNYGESPKTETFIQTEKVLPTDHPLFLEQKELIEAKLNKTFSPDDKKSDENIFEKLSKHSGSSTETLEMSSNSANVIALTTTMESEKFVDNGAEETAFMVGRMFKKFQPPNEKILEIDDLKFLNAHAHLQHDFVENDIETEDKCRTNNPCLNDGTCYMDKGKLKCDCKPGFVGERCQNNDKCLNNECTNNSTCINDPNRVEGYRCECLNGTVGKFCQVECEPDFCKNGGQCILKPTGKLGCKCASGATGSRCEREINECSFGKCQNNAKCIDLFNDYRCECAPGWMGRNCDRPCQDVYGTCRIWKREGQCELMRDTTDFFDLNCAASCGICTNGTVSGDYLPIQPILLPFAWLLGEWSATTKGWNNHTTDYPIDVKGMQAEEVLTFSVSRSLMFGQPYINYTSVVISESSDNSTDADVHTYSGFLTIQQYKNENQTNEMGALTTVSNTGLSMIEEGELLEERSRSIVTPSFVLHPTFTSYVDETKPSKLPIKMKRWFTLKNSRLLQNIVREYKDRTHKFTKIYKKTKEFQYL